MSDKYARLEIERRWIVIGGIADLIASATVLDLEDRYISGTQLRLRAVSSADAPPRWKLCKKYPRRDGDPFEFITNVYLTEAEFRLLSALPGVVARKRRYRLAVGSLDVYSFPQTSAVFEVEFDTVAQAASFVPPSFVGQEITGRASSSGAALAGAAA